MKKVKEFLASKAARVLAMVGAVSCSLCVAASAVGEVTPPTGTATVTTAFQTGFQQMASDALGMIAIIVPIALGIAGVVFLSKKAIGWFKSLAK